MLTIGRRAVTCGSVKIAGRVITRFGLSVTQPGRDVAILRGQARLPAAHAGQLVGPGIFAVLGRLGAILGRNLAVIYGLGAVIGSLGVRGWRQRTFACRVVTLARGAVTCGAVEVTRRVVASRGLTVTLFGLTVTHIRGQIAIAPFYIPLTRGCQGVLAIVRQSIPAWAGRHNNCSNQVTQLKSSWMGWLAGFEPATARSTIWCSAMLSYSHHGAGLESPAL